MLCEMLPHWIGFLLCDFLQRLQQHGAACGRLSVNDAGSAKAAAASADADTRNKRKNRRKYQPADVSAYH